MAALAASTNAPSADGSTTHKAWSTGTNPLTQRSASANASNGNVNGHAPVTQEQGKASPRETQTPDKHLHDRLIFLLSNFIGLDADLSLKNGDQFIGVFSGASSHPEPRYHLKMVRRRVSHVNGAASPSPYVGQGDDYAMAFHVNDTELLSVAGVSFASGQARAANGTAFKTDTEISGNMTLRERQLQRWTPGPDDSTDLSLGATDSLGHGGSWDQFAANEKLYNVRSDYNEDMYTTSIDKSNPLYKQRAEQAERLAREIEGSTKATAQVDSGLDEEDKYSGVRRDAPALAKSGPNAYVPPSKRTANNTNTTIATSNTAAEAAILKSINATPVPTRTSNATTPVDPAAADKQAAQKPASRAEAASTNDKGAAVKALAASGDAAPKNIIESSPDLMKDVTSAFKQFNQAEKLRLQTQRSQNQAQKATTARQEKSVKLNDLRKFSQNFKLHSRVPDDLVPILAKSKEKQEEIVKKADEHVREKEAKDAAGLATPPKEGNPASDTSTHPIVTPVDTPRDTTPATGTRARSQQQIPKGPVPNAPAPRAPSQMSQRTQVPSRGSSAAPGASTVSVPPPAVAAAAPPAPRVLSPPGASTLRFNAKAMEFKPNPAASSFMPGGPGGDAGTKRLSITSPALNAGRPAAPTEFFAPSAGKCRLAEAEASPRQKKTVLSAVAKAFERTESDPAKRAQYASNGGIPQGYRTAPVWDAPEHNQERSYATFFSQTIHPSAPINPMPGSMPHQHQLPLHLQSGPHPGGQPPFFRPDNQQHFSNGVAPSPRLGNQMLYPSPSQMPGYPFMPPSMSPAMAMRMPIMPPQPVGYGMYPPQFPPRGVPMAHQGSQQGYVMQGMPQGRGYGYPQQPGYGMMGARQMSSGGYSGQPTPRLNQATPMGIQPSSQGEEQR